jgi:putative transposase
MDDEVLRTAAAAATKRNEKRTRLQETAVQRRLGKHLGAAKKQATFNQEAYVPPAIHQEELFTRKAKLRPTPLQRKLLDAWASGANQVYNLCVNEYKIQGTRVPKGTLRALLKDTWKVERPWLATVPYEILDSSIDDFDTIFKQQATVRKEKRLAGDTTPTPFEIRFRSKKRSSVTLKVRCRASYKTSVSEGGQVRACFYVTKMDAFLREELRLPKGQPISEDVLYCAGKGLPSDITHDSELVRTPLGEYFFCYSLDRPPSEHRSTRDRLCVVAGDPGVRTFTTFYDPDGYVIEVGANDMAKLRNHGNAVDILKSKISHYRKKKTKVKVRRMQKALLRAEERIKHLVDEMHKKTACFLENHYDVVILPKFDVRSMTKRERRKINRKTTRDMLTWAHGRFRERLAFKLGDRLVDCKEDYTSKTCTRCGKINQHLGGSKTFHCRECGLVVDRDHAAARNILLKNLSLVSLRHTGTSLLAREWVSAPAASSEAVVESPLCEMKSFAGNGD